MLDSGVEVTTVLWAVATVAALIIAVPQTWLLIRTATHRDGLWWFRLKTSLLFGSLALSMLRNMAVWADYAFFEQRYLGTIAQRWTFDLGVAFLITAACCLAATLFIRVQHEVKP